MGYRMTRLQHRWSAANRYGGGPYRPLGDIAPPIPFVDTVPLNGGKSYGVNKMLPLGFRLRAHPARPGPVRLRILALLRLEPR
jgi:hypothetical protein